ncbi:MAG: hypothetical protein ACFFKA_21810 [Candidatus Thorarchaeota archaeon]
MIEEPEKRDEDHKEDDKEQNSSKQENKMLPEEIEPITSKAVVINAETYKTVILYASRYANNSIPRKDWKEIYGLLIGYSDEDFVHVERAIPMTYGAETEVQFSETDYGDVEKLLEDLEQEGKGYFIIGWFHSHPGLILFFSYIDLINQLGFQGKFEDAIGLVFDHTLLGQKKKEIVEGNILTKYDTGFEIYRLKDVNMSPNSVEFENNYYKVDYLVKGLNKFFFANVLTELSSLVSAGKPLQTSYSEQFKLDTNYRDIDEINNISLESHSKDLVEIPLNEDIRFDGDGIYPKEETKIHHLKEKAEKLIYEGNIAFNNKDAFTGIEKYRKGIAKLKEIDDIDRVMDLLRDVATKSISNNHLVYARQFAEDLFLLATKRNHLFYQGVANYIIGYIGLKEGDNSQLEINLKKIEEAAVNFIDVSDFAGAGMCFNKIGSIYEKQLKNIGSACLFYREAIENYNKAILYTHPLRVTPWSKPEILVEKIIELKDFIDVMIPDIEDLEIKQKIIEDLKLIQYNF